MCREQMAIGREQEHGLADNNWQTNSFAAWQSPCCAWCLCEQGIEMGEGSHGICSRHADELLLQYKERRRLCYKEKADLLEPRKKSSINFKIPLDELFPQNSSQVGSFQPGLLA